MEIIPIRQYLLLLTVCSAHLVVGSWTGNETDHLSLLEFKKLISRDPQQVLMTWNDSAHFCNWQGVLCRLKNPRRVISLDLSGRGLVGTVSPSLGNLTFLNHLSLPDNALTGKIPLSIGHLSRIQYLYLSNNTLQGDMPDFANCSSLKVLWLNGNHLSGQMPTYSNLPPHLEELQISYNNLTGSIPRTISNITTLSRLGIMYNDINGEIPSEIWNLPVLQVFYASGNKLTGRFQPATHNLSSLIVLNLASNYLNGYLPSNLGGSFPNLQKFGLYNNLFDGHIPNSLSNASKLSLVDMSMNNYTGVVPPSIGKLKELSWLNLEYNQLQARGKKDWDFMYSLTNCTKLQKLSLKSNQLEGQIPCFVGNLSVGLQMLYLGNNRISGDFPTGMQNLRSLTSLGFEKNHLTGFIPEGLGSLKDLEILSLSDNIFTGHIPSSLSNLSQMINLYLDTNQLNGKIPSNLGNLEVLEQLTISGNNLHGTIPKEIFDIPTITTIWLDSNSLDGPIPLEIGNAKQLQYLYLSSNNLSSSIPDTLGNCDSLEDIEMDQNFLSGSIPASLGNISSLEVLNMSHNHLSGSIPKSIGSLRYLEQLDLSFNHLAGEVPESGIFKNATAINIEGNKELCGGPTILHLPACSITGPSSTTKHTRSVIRKVAIPLASMVLLAMVIMAVVFLVICRKRQNRKFPALPSFDSNFPHVSYNDIARLTNQFSDSNLIGRGRYSSVYRGEIFQGSNVVAVKVFSLQTKGAHRSFITECNALRNVRHRNLVSIHTACSSIDSKGNDFKALIYEFMSRGDLHKVLYSTEDENSSNLRHLTLAERLNIVVDVSDALEYLHHSNQGTIVHCDIKPSNILLDENMTAHVGDFGLSRLKIDFTTSARGDSESSSSMAIKGTIGYVAPECAGGGQVSTASDVYSFGVVLLEIFIRRRPTDDMFKDGLSIARFAEINFPDRVLEIVDSQLLEETHADQEITSVVEEKRVRCLISVLNIGLCCTKSSPSERLSMQDAAAKLHSIKDAYLREN